MNTLPKWKSKLISWIAGEEPILLNFCVMGKNTPKGMSVVRIPCEGELNTSAFYSGKAFLVPARNIITGGDPVTQRKDAVH
jgi:hypothetical protein